MKKRHCEWIWLLAGWLMVAGLVGCGQIEIAASEEVTPSVMGTGTPTPPWTVVPASPGRGVQEEAVPVSPTVTISPDLVWQEPLTRDLTQSWTQDLAQDNENENEAIELAREDLARRLGIPVDSIAVVVVIRQEFPADAFYCQTGRERISREESPDTVLGETILLSAEEHRYEYHASGQTVIFCRQLP